MVGHFTDDLDDNTTICRGLGVHRVDEDFAILKPNRGDFVVNFLQRKKLHVSGNIDICGETEKRIQSKNGVNIRIEIAIFERKKKNSKAEQLADMRGAHKGQMIAWGQQYCSTR